MLHAHQTASSPASSVHAGNATPASWAAVIAIGIGAFTLVTTEFLPVGLLPDIANDLQLTEGVTGLMVTIPGIFAAIAAPATLIAAGRWDRRHVLMALLALLVLSNLVVGFAPNVYFLLLGRMLLGLAVGGFWTVAGALGPRLRPGRDAGRATSIILSGISLGTVAGVPAGTLAGQFAGWRAVFMAAAVVAVLVVLTLAKLVPSLPAKRTSGVSHLYRSLRLPQVKLGLLAVGLAFAGQFAAYTYIAPFFDSTSGIRASTLSAVLLGYGVAGFFGNLLGGWLATQSIKRTFLITTLLLGAGLAVLYSVGAWSAPAIATTLAWGIGFGMLPIASQTLMLSADPERPESVSALLVTSLQAAIGLGALGGGIAVDHFGVAGPILLGAACALLSACFVFAYPGPRKP